MATLYDLTMEYKNLLDVAMSDDDEQAFLDTVEPLLDEIAGKADGYVAVIDSLETRAAMYEKQAAALVDGAGMMKARARKLKERMKQAMESMGLDKIQSQYHTLTIRKNGGVKPLAIKDDNIPDQYMKMEIVMKPNREKIRADLEKGKNLPFAELKERGTSLVIK